jgi:hypothetical protein
MDEVMESRLNELEQELRRLRVSLSGSLIGVLLLILFLVAEPVLAGSRENVPSDSLRVRELVVVDRNDSVRVRIAAHLPDAVINGRAISRGEDASGILLYDDTGRERGGYVTFAPSGNVALTLDTRDRQAALFVAGPEDAAAARLWSGDSWIEMRADAKGSRLGIGNAGELVVQQPPMSEAENDRGCVELQEELEQFEQQPPIEQVLIACKRQMTDDACRRCLDIP